MKTQTFGLIPYSAAYSRLLNSTISLVDGISINGADILRPLPGNAYRKIRENGSHNDAPPRTFPYDGTCSWATPNEEHSKVRYDEGPKDKAWMEEKDRNYVFHLEREGRLDKEELNLKSEMPKLYEEIMAHREKQKLAQQAQIEKERQRQEKMEQKKREQEKIKQERKKQERIENEKRQQLKAEQERQEKKRQQELMEQKKPELNPIIPGLAKLSISYRIDPKAIVWGKRLGAGGFGEVFQGTYQYNLVAIKKLRLQDLSEEALNEFNYEVKLMAKLRNPKIVQFFGATVETPYSLVMEYMSKGSLYSVLHNKKPLPWGTRFSVAGDIAKGIIYLHAQNIIHRDLKSPNVLLDDHFQAKLTDFGLSKIKKETTSSAKSSAIVGSVAWMAPELFMRKAKHEKPADIYAYGMILWELASRKIPWQDAASPAVIPSWVTQGEREEIPKTCPPKLAHLIKSCWAGDATQRPTAEAALKKLQKNSDEQKIDEQDNASSQDLEFSYQGNFSNLNSNF